MKLENTPVLVTGGSSGLGAATARGLAKAGAKVAVLARTVDRANAVAAEIGGIAVRCDVSDAASAEAAVAEARAAHGPARMLVHCAGAASGARIVGRNGPMSLDAFRELIEVNLIGAFNMLRLAAADMAALESLQDGERGVVILTGSIAAYEGQIGQAGYAAAKAGVNGLIMPAARELAASGIRVMAIAPSIFETSMMAGASDELRAKMSAGLQFPKRFGAPEEFASAVQMIAGNLMLNGSVIRLDGGVRMGAK